MEKQTVYKELVNLGNGRFSEEVRNSYVPEPFLKEIYYSLQNDILEGVSTRNGISSWQTVILALLEAKDLFSKEELDAILKHEYNLHPDAVGGSEKFFTFLGNMLNEIVEKANQRPNS